MKKIVTTSCVSAAIKGTVLFLLCMFSRNSFSQTITITDIETTGRFNSCPQGDKPGITATFISGSGTSVVNNQLVCNDPCGTTTLRILLTNVRWNQQPDDNWIHGIFFPQTPGFTVSGVSLPAGWGAFQGVTGAPCSAAQAGGPGFYFDGETMAICCTNSAMDGDPSNNYGDVNVECGTPLSFHFDMTFCNSAIKGGLVDFTLRGTSDGNTGCWNAPDLANNTIAFKIATVACPDIYNVPFAVNLINDCSEVPFNPRAEITGGCGNGNIVTWWDAPFGGNQIGTGVPFVYDPAGSACPVGTTLWASCCPIGSTACANRFAVPINGSCIPEPTVTHSKTAPVCSSNNGTIAVTPSTTGSNTVVLTGPGGPYTLTGAGTQTFTALGPGSYSYTFISPLGCAGAGGPVVLIINSPVLFARGTAVHPTCTVSGSVSFNPTGGTAPYAFSSDGGAVFQPGNSFTGLAAGTYNFRIKDNFGCLKDTTIILRDPPALTANITNSSLAGCLNNNGSLSAIPMGGTAPFTFTITGAVINTTGATSGVFTGLAAGSYTITIRDAMNCTASTNGTVFSSPLVTAGLVSTTAAGCADNIGTVTVSVTGGTGPFAYTIAGPTVNTTGATNGAFTGLASGAYVVTVTDAQSCMSTVNATVAATSPLVATLSAMTAAGCTNNNGSLSTTTTGGTAPLTFSIAGPTVNTTGAATGLFTGLGNGAYTITATDAQGCKTSTTGTVTLADNMFLQLDAEATVCAGSPVTFMPRTNDDANTFTWTGINGTATSTIANPAILQAVATPADTAMYELHVQYGACERKDTIVVNVLHKPVANAGVDTLICKYSDAVLMGSAGNVSGPVSFEWTPAARVVFPRQAVTPVTNINNNTVYTLTVKDNYGCNFTDSAEVTVSVKMPVPAFAGNDTNVVRNLPVQLMASGGVSYVWSPSILLNDATLQNPIATLQRDQRFTVIVTDDIGCTGAATVLIKVFEQADIYVATAFTPNGDGINDILKAVPVGMKTFRYLRVFNRWGELIFSTQNPSVGWDGTIRAVKQPTSTFVWMAEGVDYLGNKVFRKGTVTLVR